LKASLLIIIVYRKKGKAFIIHIPKKNISLNHALLISVDILSNLLDIMANYLGINKGLINMFIYVSHLLQEEHVVPIQLIIVGVNHLVVTLK
jgi:hypothetical protein